MNVIILAIAVTSIVVLIYVRLTRRDYGIDSELLQEEVSQQWEDGHHRSADESSFLFADRDPWLTQQPEPVPKPIENVTTSPTNTADQSRCPACGANITVNDERCPSCEISFVTDGISLVTDSVQKWAPRTVGPADGIFLPPTEFRK